MKKLMTKRTAYWAVTGLFSLMIAAGAAMYFIQHDMVESNFLKLGYPTYIMYPLAFAKFLGVIAIVSNKSRSLKEWAHAGFFFELVLAIAAHTSVGDGEQAGALFALILAMSSYAMWKRGFHTTDVL